MWNINENTIRVTEYDVLGELPDPFLFDDGGRIRTKEDWEKRRAEIYKTTVELQYGEYRRSRRCSRWRPLMPAAKEEPIPTE